MQEQMDIRVMRSQLGRARGLGSAHAGVHHWQAERITAIALVPLTAWFVISVMVLIGADQPTMVRWVARPWNTVLLLALIGMTFHHMHLGLQVVYEDYIHEKWAQNAAILATRGASLLLALFAAVAVLKMAF